MLKALKFSDMIFNYGRFHNNKVNQAIHFIFIPIIQFTLFILGAVYWHTLPVSYLEGVVPGGYICIETWVFSFCVVVAYFIADPGTAIVTTLWSVAQLIAAQHMAAANADVFTGYISGHAFQLKDFALYLHLGAWLAQFYGHGVHEGRAPALMTNIFYALLAPFFITFEFLYLVFSYKKDEMKSIRKRIEEDIEAFELNKGR